MPIRSHDDAMSSVAKMEYDWFRRAHVKDTDLNRFIFMQKGSRDKTWTFKKDLTLGNYDDDVFVINEQRFVNRPDAISYEFYGNAKFWWLIAMRNDIKDPFTEFHIGKRLLIPKMQLIKKEFGL